MKTIEQIYKEFNRKIMNNMKFNFVEILKSCFIPSGDLFLDIVGYFVGITLLYYIIGGIILIFKFF